MCFSFLYAHHHMPLWPQWQLLEACCVSAAQRNLHATCHNNPDLNWSQSPTLSSCVPVYPSYGVVRPWWHRLESGHSAAISTQPLDRYLLYLRAADCTALPGTSLCSSHTAIHPLFNSKQAYPGWYPANITILNRCWNNGLCQQQKLFKYSTEIKVRKPVVIHDLNLYDFMKSGIGNLFKRVVRTV